MYFKIIVYMKSFIIYFMNTNNAHYLALKIYTELAPELSATASVAQW